MAGVCGFVYVHVGGGVAVKEQLLVFGESNSGRQEFFPDKTFGGFGVAVLDQERLVWFTKNTFGESLRAYILAVNIFFILVCEQ